MRSPNRTYNLEADELRGAAALLVFFYHSINSGATAVGAATGRLTSQNPFATLIYEGHTGVALFMVLSGYILASGTFDRDINYRGFLKNRLLRIFPLMIVVLVFAMYTAKSTDLGSIAAPFLLLANLPTAFSSPSNLSGAVWTISVEFQFYLIAPFLFLFAGRYGFARFLLPAMLLFWLLKIVVLLPLLPEAQYRANYYTIVGRIDQFMIGITLAYLIHTDRLSIVANLKGGFALLTSAGLGILMLVWFVNQQGGLTVWRWWHLVYPEIEGLLWGAFIAGYLAVAPLRNTLASKVFRWIGMLSFSIYILHYAIQYEFWTALRLGYVGSIQTGMLGVVAMSCCVLAAVIGLSMLSYYCIERPFLEMRGRYLANSKPGDLPRAA